jgi:hypothetical protein
MPMTTFSSTYPNIAYWTESFIRVFNEGGTVWEGKSSYKSLDDALSNLKTHDPTKKC